MEAAPTGPSRPRFPASHLFLLFVAAFWLFFAGLGRLSLVEPDEGRNAEVAREMLVTGDWAVPHFDGFTYLDKPPLYFWSVAMAFELGGLSEAAARFSSALAALGTMLLVWYLARLMFGDFSGLYAGIIFATSPLVVIFAREVIFDMTLTLLVTAAMVCYWRAEGAGQRRKLWDLLFFAAMGLATLTKGPVGFLIPLLAVVIYQALRGRLASLKNLNWALGLAVFLAIVLPWFITVCVRHPDFPKYAFWEESLQRFATGHSHRSGPVYYYILIYLAGFFPWSFFLLAAAYHRVKRWRELRQEQHAPALFLLCWVGLIFVFFTISKSKLPGYFLPACIPLSILLARVWRERRPEANRAPDWLTAGFAVLIVIGILIAVATHFGRLPFLPGRLEHKMPSRALPLLTPAFFYTGAILAALGIIGRDLCSRAKAKAPTLLIFLLASLTFPLLLVRWFGPLEAYASADSSRSLAETIRSSPQKDLPVYGYYYFRTSLPFYLRRPVGLVSADANQLTSNYIVSRWPQAAGRNEATRPPRNLFAGSPGAAPLVMDERDWLAFSRTTPVLVMAPDDQVPRLAAAVHRMEPLWSGWKYSVWEILPKRQEPSPPAKQP